MAKVTLKENVMFDDLSDDLKESMRLVGFKDGDNLSNFATEMLKEKGLTIEDYFDEDYFDE